MFTLTTANVFSIHPMLLGSFGFDFCGRAPWCSEQNHIKTRVLSASMIYYAQTSGSADRHKVFILKIRCGEKRLRSTQNKEEIWESVGSYSRWELHVDAALALSSFKRLATVWFSKAQRWGHQFNQNLGTLHLPELQTQIKTENATCVPDALHF